MKQESSTENHSSLLRAIREKYEKVEKKEATPKVSKKYFIKLMLGTLKPFWVSWFFILLTSLILAGVTVAIPKITNLIFSDISQNIMVGKKAMPWNVLVYWVIGFALAFIFSAVLRYVQNWFTGHIAWKIEIAIRLKVLNKILDLDLAFYEDKKMGNILTRLISDTHIIGQQAYQIPISFFNAVFVFMGSLAIMFTLKNSVTNSQGVTTTYAGAEAELASIVLGVALLVCIVAVVMFTFLRKRMYQQRKVISQVNGDVNDRINALKLIKATANYQYEKNRFKKIHKDYYYVSMRAVRFNGLIFAIVITFFTSMNIVALLTSIVYINENKLNPTLMVALTLAINSLIIPILQVVRMFSNFASASSSSSRVFEILDKQPTIFPHLNQPTIKQINKGIEFKNVDFRYKNKADSPYILKNFSFTFEHNKSYALVSESGVGKTSIARLLLRMWDVTAGEIILHNQEESYLLKEINLHAYLNQVGYVEQEPEIIFGDVYENVKYGVPNATNEDVHEAIKKAQLNQFVESLPDDYHTLLGEKGFVLSGGQKQRLIIARMFLRNPNILILDEATSSLDNIVEQEIQKELNALMVNRSTIVIAHRLSTIKHVDQILVLEKNRGIVQQGTFEELIAKEGRFKKLYLAGLMT